MSQSALPVLIQYIQAFAVILIPVIGALIAWQQVEIAWVKLQHDLYDRRFAVFQARKLLDDVLAHGDVSDEQLRTYVVGTSDSVFLLGDEMSQYLEEIRKRVTRRQAIKDAISRSQQMFGRERTAMAKEEQEMTKAEPPRLRAGMKRSWSRKSLDRKQSLVAAQ